VLGIIGTHKLQYQQVKNLNFDLKNCQFLDPKWSLPRKK
jgi:hypothetical protein